MVPAHDPDVRARRLRPGYSRRRGDSGHHRAKTHRGGVEQPEPPEYHNDQPLNIGQNRWYGRIGAPVVWQLGSWAPERRTTIEILPAIWFFSANTDFVGKTMENDALFQLEGHVTHNFTKSLWGALDMVWYAGGKATIDDVPGEKLNNAGLGFTLGYLINDNLQFMVGYAATVNDGAPTDLRLSQFRATLVYGWHSLIEGTKRLGGST